MSLLVKINAQGDDVDLFLSGMIDENCQMPVLPAVIPGKLRIHLSEMKMINSMGVRKWVNWIREQAGAARGGVSLIDCSPPVVNQINILSGFLPPSVRVESFSVPYYCEDCSHEDQIFLKCGVDFDDQGTLKVQDEVPCPMCKSMMTMDAIPKRYFKFLEKKIA